MNGHPSSQSPRWLPILVAALAFLLYANTIGNDYALDDGAVITANPYVQQGLKGIPGIFTVDIWHFEGTGLGYYRPLSLATFAVENQFSPNNPHASHFINALLYAFTCSVLYLLLLQMFGSYNPLFSFIITLFFAAHPIHTEVVANIKSRDEILAFLNLILALYFLLRSTTGGWKWLLPSCFFYYLALLSKETALTGVLLAPAVLYFTSRLNFKQILKHSAPFVAVLLLFELQKYWALGPAPAGDTTDIVSFPYTTSDLKLPTAFAHLGWYIKLIFIPYPLSYNYAYNQIPVTEWASSQTVLGILISFVLLSISFLRIRKKTPLQFGTLIFGLTLLPAIAFVWLKGGILAERFLYGPSLGFCIVITWGLFKLVKTPLDNGLRGPEIPRSKLVPFIIIFSCYSFVTISRNAEWKDDLTISRHDVKVTPHSCQVHLHYGKKLIDLGAMEKDPQKRREYFNTGTEQLNQAITINIHYARAYYKLAYAYQVVEPNADSAIYYYNRAIDEAPGYALAYNNLGSLYTKLGRMQLAEHYLQKALQLNPDLTEAANNLQYLQHVQNVHSSNTDTTSFEYYSTTGVKYAREKNFTSALKYLLKAVEIKPKSVDALVNLAACYGMMQDFSKSESTLLKAQQLEPDNKSVVQNLFTLYHLSGNKAKEQEYKIKLARLKPQ